MHLLWCILRSHLTILSLQIRFRTLPTWSESDSDLICCKIWIHVTFHSNESVMISNVCSAGTERWQNNLLCNIIKYKFIFKTQTNVFQSLKTCQPLQLSDCVIYSTCPKSKLSPALTRLWNFLFGNALNSRCFLNPPNTHPSWWWRKARTELSHSLYEESWVGRIQVSVSVCFCNRKHIWWVDLSETLDVPSVCTYNNLWISASFGEWKATNR